MTCTLAALFAACVNAADQPVASPSADAGHVSTEASWPTDPAQAATLLRITLPGMQGWSLSAGPQTHTGEGLRDYLRGEADRFLMYDLRWVVSATLKSATEGSIAIDVFAFPDDMDAFGAFAQGRTEKTTSALIAAMSFWNGPQLHIWRGPLYVRLIPTQPSEKARAACSNLGEALFAALPSAPPLPPPLSLLPTANLRPCDTRFARRGVMGQPMLTNGITAIYDEDLPAYYLAPAGKRSGLPRTAEIKLVVLEGVDDADGERLYGELQRVLSLSPQANPVAGLGNAALYGRTAGNSRALLMRVRNYACAITGFDQYRAAEGLMRLLGSNVRIMLNARPVPPPE